MRAPYSRIRKGQVLACIASGIDSTVAIAKRAHFTRGHAQRWIALLEGDRLIVLGRSGWTITEKGASELNAIQQEARADAVR